jgi:molybdate transport system ATP-binding protein
MLSVDVLKQRGDFTLRTKFEAPTPGIISLFGHSGCGKTTLVDIIAGLLEPDAGRVTLEGLELSMPAEQRRIGYVFQDARLFPHYSVEGNLRYGLKRARGASIGFDDIVSLLGLSALLIRKPNELSGGERQRVALGRALLSHPRLLLLDEPLAALDVARREEVMPYLERLRDQLSIPMIYVSHQLDEVLRLATYIVLMESGTATAQGSPTQISLQPRFQTIAGREAVGAVLDAIVIDIDPHRRLVELRIGNGTLRVAAGHAKPGATVRVQILARDIILATEAPRGLSVRNSIAGRIESISPEDAETQLAQLDVGGASLIARVTRDAADELHLHPGMAIWALVKAVSMRIL